MEEEELELTVEECRAFMAWVQALIVADALGMDDEEVPAENWDEEWN